MKLSATIILLLIGRLCSANMASPIREGTFSSSAFSSRDIDIIKEKIFVKTDKDFQTAFYSIECFIKTDIDGKQIPLLFHAKDYKGDFKIWVDDRETTLLNIPSEYTNASNTPFEKFSNYFRPPSREGEPETVVINWEKHSGSVYNLNELKYFEADLTKGEHKIRVEYTAYVWTDVSDWVKQYSFRYSLSPAKNWKSFGSLEITVDASDFNQAINTNVGQPSKGNINSIAIWNFSKLPADYFEIIYDPRITGFAKLMLAIGPSGLAIIIGLLITLLHFFSIKTYRKYVPEKKYSWVVIVGSLVNPLFILIGYVVSYSLIDNAIGVEAGNYHGYTFLAVILYPLLLPVYWVAMWLADRQIKKRMKIHSNFKPG